MAKSTSPNTLKYSEQLKEIRQILYKLLEIEKPELVLEHILKESARVLDADSATIVLWESDLGFFNTIHNMSSDLQLKGMILIPEQGGLDGRIFREKLRRPIALSNYSKNMDAYSQLKPVGFQYAMGIPLYIQEDNMIGSMCFYFMDRTEKMSENEELLLDELGQQTSIAILNARLFQQLEQSRKSEEEARNFLDLLLNSSPDIVINLDLTGKIKFWNKAAENLTSFSANVMMNQKLPLVSGKNEENFYQLFADARKGTPILNNKFLLESKSSLDLKDKDDYKSINLSLVPVRNQKESIDSILVTGQDISEKQSLKKQVNDINIELNEKEIALNQNEKLLHQAQKNLIIAEKLATIGVLSEKLNHQINNPLMGMLSALSIISDDISELHHLSKASTYEKQKLENLVKDIEEVSTEGNRIKEVLKHLRFFSEVAKEEHFRENTDLFDVLNQVISEIKSQTIQDQIKIKINKSVNKAKIHGNFNQLKYVLRVILDNCFIAINQKFENPKDGDIEINIESFLLNQQNQIRLSISDNGTGIQSDNIDKIYDPFFSEWNKNDNPSNDLELNHIGLSLATAKIIIQNHNAHISVESKYWDENTKKGSKKESGTKIFIDFPEID